MRKAVRDLFNTGFCALTLPLFAQATKYQTTQKAESAFMVSIKELAKEWWLWGGLLVIGGLLGYLWYLKSHQDDD